MKPEFAWASPRGISVTLLITIAVIYVLIGAMRIVVVRYFGTAKYSGQYYLGTKVDSQIFGKLPGEFAKQSPEIGTRRKADAANYALL